MGAEQIKTLADSHDSHSDGDNVEYSWTESEEKALVRNGNALTDYFLKDVGITQNQFNVGQQLLSAGIVILEIPSNLVLYKVGPSKWIGSQIVAWYGLMSQYHVDDELTGFLGVL
ncbi:putative alternative sulfate transporter protein [Phaeoacremonium minimum UCRPA7]|uniref:Putative alternative sulfate transporter protein n=1 Tax=Phaeoacremonium minimum (strain UCR-PA7) TaxID=1286976 RepID=R8BB47_PHAM7|nr:putative alternative sulfate transporter protein [Phaeoacremonium minimum UCRPA7]EON96521.1 putative alternative sulfate transporter protein [Phaeoacremonium minimum UCRPA7]